MERAQDRLIGNQHTLGETVIDAGYQAIARCWSHAVTCPELQFPMHNARLRKLLTALHEGEQKLIESAGGWMCACHRQEHDALLAICQKAKTLQGSHWRKAQSLLRRQFRRLFREHIICMDSITVLLVRESRTGAS